MRETCRAIIIKDDKIVLIYRERGDMKYYVFPGGGIEPKETKEECVIRELKEELGINIKPIKQVYEVRGDTFLQHIFLCEWIDGILGMGNEEEYALDRKGGTQVPVFLDISSLKDIYLLSDKVKNMLLDDISKYGYNLDDNIKTIHEIAKF